MKEPAVPDFEEQRLEALQKLRLWKTVPDDGFDRITRLVRRFMNASVAQINLVSKDTVWAKSSVGDLPAECPRKESFCSQTILENDIFCLTNIGENPDYCENAYQINGKKPQFYVGVPLYAQGGLKVGTLCVFDTNNRTLQPEEYEALQDFALTIQQQFNLSNLERDGKFLVSQTLRLNTLLDALADGIVTIDNEGKIESLNKSAADIFGYSASELIGEKFLLLMPDLGGGGWDGYLAILLGSEKSFEPAEKPDLLGLRKDGTFFPMELNVREMNLDGRRSYTGVIRDITDRKAVEDEILEGQQILEATKENVPSGLTVFDQNLRLKVINSQVQSLLDLPEEALKLGTRFQQLATHMFNRGDFGHWTQKNRDKQLRRLLENPKEQRFVHIAHLDRYIEINSRRMPGGGFISTYIDITSRLKNEEKLEALLKQANDANQAKTNFLSTISHEIRTPLNGVIGMAHMLKETSLTEDQQQMLQTVLHSGNTLLSLINDVLDMNKIESGNLEIENIFCDLTEIVNSVKAPFEVQASQKGIDLQVSIKPDIATHVYSDPTRLRQILMNLLSNAMKFTEKGHIVLAIKSVKASGTNPQVTQISVSDTGVGISEDRLEAIFHSFSQADNTINRRFGGTGLGLSIVRSLVRLMHGEIQVSSVKGQGSTFTVELPFKVATADVITEEEIRMEAAEVIEIGSLNVLVVEDTPMNAMITCSFLKSLGHQSEVAENGQIALDKLAQSPFDLILMDVHMPVMDGIEATKRIRKKRSENALPIIGVTAEAFADRHAVMKEIGMNEVITKPFTKEQLKKVTSPFFTHKAERTDAEPEDDTLGLLGGTKRFPIGSDAKMDDFFDQLGPDVTYSLIAKSPEAVKTELKTLQEGLDARDSTVVYRAAHTIAGVASSMCAERLVEQATIFQQNAENLPEIEKSLIAFEKTAEETFKWWSGKIKVSG